MTRIISFSILLAVGLAVSSSLLAQNPETKKSSFLDLPEVEGWTKSDPHIYEEPGLGHSVNYDSKDGGRVTVYLYDRGFESIPSGVENALVIQEIEAAKQEIMESVRNGTYEGAKPLQTDYVTIGGPEGKVSAMRMLLTLEKHGGEFRSEIYLFAAHNKFVKIRSTRTENEYGLTNPAFETLMKELDAAFSK